MLGRNKKGTMMLNESSVFYPLRRAAETSLHALTGFLQDSPGHQIDGQGFLRGLGKSLFLESSRLLKQSRANVPFLNPLYFTGLKPGLYEKNISAYRANFLNEAVSSSGSFGRKTTRYVVDDTMDIFARKYFDESVNIFDHGTRRGVKALRDIGLPHVEAEILKAKNIATENLAKNSANALADDVTKGFTKNLENANKDLKVLADYKIRSDKWVRAENYMRLSTPIRLASAVLTAWQINSAIQADWKTGNLKQSFNVLGDIVGSHVFAKIGARIGNSIAGPRLAIPMAVVFGGLGSVYGQRFASNFY